MDYSSLLDGHDALRTHILAELSAKPSRFAVQDRSLSSYIAQFRKADPEVDSTACVDPVETAAGKLSAFSGRSLVTVPCGGSVHSCTAHPRQSALNVRLCLDRTLSTYWHN